jgi:replicative DNA helicase
MNDNLRTERALLGYLIGNQSSLALVKPIIMRISYFTIQTHKTIYTALLDLESDGYDEIIIGNHLKKQGKLQAIGGYAYIAELLECAPYKCNIVFYAKLIREYYHVQEVLKESAKLAQTINDKKQSVFDIVSKVVDNLQKLQAELGARQNKVRSVAEIAPIVFRNMEQAAEGKIIPALSTGFENLDAYLGGGLYPAEFTIVGGRPSTGKTSLVMNIADNLSPKEKVLFVSLETTGELLTLCRLLPINSRIPSTTLRNPQNLNADDWDRLGAANNKIGAYNNFKICDQSGMNIEDLESLIDQEMNKNGGFRLLIIDYLQLLRSRKRFKQREERVSYISQKVSDVIKEYNLYSLVCSQLNREADKTKRPPILSDLRESGQLEQDADIILLLHRDKDDVDAPTSVIVAKNKNGATGQVDLIFDQKTTRFRNQSDAINF